MRRRITSLSLFAAAVLSTLAAGAVQAQDSVAAAAAENGRLWFVELSGAPVADGNTLAAVRNEKAAFRRAAAAVGAQFTERRSFDTLFNGFSVEAGPRDRAKLAALPGVKAMYPVELIQAPAPERGVGGAAPDLATAIAMTGANLAQASGWTGTGVKVAVMDTGIDIDHPDFGGSGVNGTTAFPSARVAYGHDFVGDAFDADSTSPTYNPVPTPDHNPDDCNGHGSHVAGIVGANGTVKGVAPGVTFGAYRVFGCNGSTTADIMISAMERALADGMHVLNMSIGSSFQWPQYPTAVAASRLVDKGMVVVASIGNSGANGLYSAGAPGLGEKVIGVASYDNSHLFLPYATVNGSNVGYITMTFSPPAPTSGSSAVVNVGLACAALPAGSLTGRTALAARGTCSFAVKATNAIAAGADAVLISNNVAGVFNGTLGAALPNPKPVVGISLADGNFIRAQAAPVITWTSLQASFPNPTGGLISSFSSYGLSPDLALKPDLGAPGGNIYSTYPLEQGGYASLSGTSMSSPHVAGGVALLLQARPGTPARAVRTMLQNSADPKVWSLNPGLGFLDHVHRQGAGMLDIDDAILATTKVEPGKIATGEGQAGPYTQTLTIENKGPAAVTYNLSSVNAVSTGGVITPTFSLGGSSVAFGAPSVVAPAGGTASVSATITPAAGPVNGQYGGYIELTDASDATRVLRVPFAGFVGDYQGIQMLTPTANGFPWLAQLSAGNFFNRPAGATYTMVGDDIPFFLVHLDHHARRMEFQVLNAATGAPVHPVFSNSDEFDFLPRNATPTGFFAFEWDGTRMHDKGKGTADHRKAVPNGKYVVVMKTLKALGDAANPAHWETWTSPVVTLARP